MAEPKIWMNGKLVTQAEAVLPVNSAAVFYATNVFEGLRAYWNETDDQLYCFRLDEHFARFRESMKMMRFTGPYSDAAHRQRLPRGHPHAPRGLRGRRGHGSDVAHRTLHQSPPPRAHRRGYRPP